MYLSTIYFFFFFFSSRRRHTRYIGDWSSDVCSSDLAESPRSLIISVSIVGSPGRCPPLASSDCNDDHSSQVGNAVTFRLSVRHASRFVHGQSIRHDPPTTGVEEESLWSSSFPARGRSWR